MGFGESPALTPDEIIALANAATALLNASQIDTSMATDAELAAHSATGNPHSDSESTTGAQAKVDTHKADTDYHAPLTNSGEYSGNAEANTAINHGLGSKYVGAIIQNVTTGDLFFHFGATGTVISYQNGSGQGTRTVTASNSTSFKVGNAASYDQSANQTGQTYKWIAYGVL